MRGFFQIMPGPIPNRMKVRNRWGFQRSHTDGEWWLLRQGRLDSRLWGSQTNGKHFNISVQARLRLLSLSFFLWIKCLNDNRLWNCLNVELIFISKNIFRLIETLNPTKDYVFRSFVSNFWVLVSEFWISPGQQSQPLHPHFCPVSQVKVWFRNFYVSAILLVF